LAEGRSQAWRCIQGFKMQHSTTKIVLRKRNKLKIYPNAFAGGSRVVLEQRQVIVQQQTNLKVEELKTAMTEELKTTVVV